MRRIQFVVKVSKLCNLRCSYCYEFEHLAKKERISLNSLEAMYQNIAGWHETLDSPTELEFVWHGGEPLLLPPSFFRSTFEHQQAVFGPSAHISNSAQTNLTVKLDDDRLDLLRDGFDAFGVSVDLFGQLRVNTAGDDSLPRTLQNMDRLRAERIPFGAITVLSGANVANIRKIVRFFHDLKVSFRLLPLFDGAFEDQHQGYEISHEQVLEAFKDVFEQLLELDSPIRVDPLRSWILEVMHRYEPGAERAIYDRSQWEAVMVVDTDGSLYCDGDRGPRFRKGNIFEQSMQECLQSLGHQAGCEIASARMQAVCGQCEYFGSCSGAPIGNRAGEHLLTLGSVGKLRCILEQGMLQFLEKRMLELGIVKAQNRRDWLQEPAPGVMAAFV